LPPPAEKLLDEAIQLHRSGSLEAAEQTYRRILVAAPNDRDALNNLGILLRNMGRLNESIETLQTAIRQHPTFPEARNSLGLALIQAGRFAEALAVLDQALAIQPDFTIAHKNIAFAHERSGQLEAALKSIRHYLTFKPDDAEALNSLGFYLIQSGQPNPALQALTRAVELAPAWPAPLINLAMVLERLDQYADAIDVRKRAMVLNPGDGECLSDLAISEERLGRIDDAIQSRRLYIDLTPEDAHAKADLGRLLTEAGLDDEAARWFDQALALAPEEPRIHFNKGLFLLRKGVFAEGWAEHEWRLKFASLTGLFPAYPQPYWDGSDLAGKTIFLHGEQGWGDTIQCARYVPQVAAMTARVVLGVREPLARLLSDLPGVDQLITDPDDLPDFDVRCSLLSLPHFFGADETTLPANVSYLKGPGNLVPKVTSGHLDVGLVWGGSPTHKNDHNRSMDLADLKPLLNVEGCIFHSLQVDGRRQDIAHAGLQELVLDTGATLEDLADTADAITGLDLVITVDTAVAHLAGALGKPVWILLAEPSDWRWLRDREDSPWYPTARLFRQKRRGDWSSVVGDVTNELGHLAKSQAGRLS
jgi:Flp pilus assembly protein TadD